MESQRTHNSPNPGTGRTSVRLAQKKKEKEKEKKRRTTAGGLGAVKWVTGGRSTAAPSIGSRNERERERERERETKKKRNTKSTSISPFEWTGSHRLHHQRRRWRRGRQKRLRALDLATGPRTTDGETKDNRQQKKQRGTSIGQRVDQSLSAASQWPFPAGRRSEIPPPPPPTSGQLWRTQRHSSTAADARKNPVKLGKPDQT